LTSPNLRYNCGRLLPGGDISEQASSSRLSSEIPPPWGGLGWGALAVVPKGVFSLGGHNHFKVIPIAHFAKMF